MVVRGRRTLFENEYQNIKIGVNDEKAFCLVEGKEGRVPDTILNSFNIIPNELNNSKSCLFITDFFLNKNTLCSIEQNNNKLEHTNFNIIIKTLEERKLSLSLKIDKQNENYEQLKKDIFDKYQIDRENELFSLPANQYSYIIESSKNEAKYKIGEKIVELKYLEADHSYGSEEEFILKLLIHEMRSSNSKCLAKVKIKDKKYYFAIEFPDLATNEIICINGCNKETQELILKLLRDYNRIHEFKNIKQRRK